jgi:hypothetical protein
VLPFLFEKKYDSSTETEKDTVEEGEEKYEKDGRVRGRVKYRDTTHFFN